MPPGCRASMPLHTDPSCCLAKAAGRYRVAVLDERITVCKADPSWPNWFQQEAARLRSVLPGDLVPEIQHIGSTAVPGLDAKPIVDVMVGIVEPGRIAEVVERLEQARLREPRRSRRARPMGAAEARCRAAQQHCDRRLRGRMVEAQPCRPGLPACECRGSPELRFGEMACRQRWRRYVARLLGRQARDDRKDRRGGAPCRRPMVAPPQVAQAPAPASPE